MNILVLIAKQEQLYSEKKKQNWIEIVIQDGICSKDNNMKLQDYVIEVSLGKDPKTEALFNRALKEIFSLRFYNKIQDVVKKHIPIIHDSHTEYQDSPASSKGGKIYTTNVFERKSPEDKMRFLLHEFIHVLQDAKSFFIFNRFKELDVLSKKLMGILKKHLIKPIDIFLTNKNQGKALRNKKMEIVAYAMNNSINWQALSPQGQQLFVGELRKSGLFNLTSKSWQRRLPR